MNVKRPMILLAGTALAYSAVVPRHLTQGSDWRLDTPGWINPHRPATSVCRAHDQRGSACNGLRSTRARSLVAAYRRRPRRPRAVRSLCVADAPVAAGDTRDLLQTTPQGDANAESSSATAGQDGGAEVDDGHAPEAWLDRAISREAHVCGHRVSLRIATPDDFLAVADVRFDVFSPVHATLKHRFRERSCMLMRERRHRGAFCLIAALEMAASGSAKEDAVRERLDPSALATCGNHVLGTLECSRHEFDGTPLAVNVEGSAGRVDRLYVTEVAVRSDCRRQGVGRILLGMVDAVAQELQTSEVFLHVNEVNTAALKLYEACGYEEAPNCAQNRAFTSSLGLAGGFIGQRHYLLRKTFHDGRST